MRYVLDNFPQENEEKNLGEKSLDSENISDIQFEETKNEDLYAEEPAEETILAETLDEAESAQSPMEDIIFDEIDSPEQTDSSQQYEPIEGEISDQELTKKLESEFVMLNSNEPLSPGQPGYEESPYANQTDQNAKKYVIYINSENIEFIDSLSINERREIINKILREKNDSICAQKAVEKRTHFIKHAIVTSLTLIVCIPALFFAVNKSLEVSIDNYQSSRKNFIKLYREQGKIKPVEKKLLKD